MNTMYLICALLCLLLLIAIISSVILLIKAKKALKEEMADKRALLLILGKDKYRLIKEVEKINDLYDELATSEVGISTDIKIIERARKLLINEIRK